MPPAVIDPNLVVLAGLGLAALLAVTLMLAARRDEDDG